MSDDWIRYRELVLQTVKDLREGIASVSTELKDARAKMDGYFREQDKLSEKVVYLELRFKTLERALETAQDTLNKLDDNVDGLRLEAAEKKGTDDVRHTSINLKLGFVLAILVLVGVEVVKWLVKNFVM